MSHRETRGVGGVFRDGLHLLLFLATWGICTALIEFGVFLVGVFIKVLAEKNGTTPPSFEMFGGALLGALALAIPISFFIARRFVRAYF